MFALIEKLISLKDRSYYKSLCFIIHENEYDINVYNTQTEYLVKYRVWQTFFDILSFADIGAEIGSSPTFFCGVSKTARSKTLRIDREDRK